MLAHNGKQSLENTYLEFLLIISENPIEIFALHYCWTILFLNNTGYFLKNSRTPACLSNVCNVSFQCISLFYIVLRFFYFSLFFFTFFRQLFSCFFWGTVL